MKKLISLLLTVLLLLPTGVCGICAQAEDAEPEFVIGSAEGERGDTVSLTVSIRNNPGIIALRFSVQYDADVLSLESVTDGQLFGHGRTVFGTHLTANPYTMYWEDSLSYENYTNNGVFVTLTFRIREGAAVGESPVTLILDNNSIFDCNVHPVPFQAVSGTVTVFDLSPFLTAKPEASAVIEDDGTIRGLRENLTVQTLLDAYVKIENTGALTGPAVLGTGAVLELTDTRTQRVSKTYTVLLYGDIDGDAQCDGQDAVLADCIANNLLTAAELSAVQLAAADCDGSGAADVSDVELLVNAGLKISEISQSSAA